MIHKITPSEDENYRLKRMKTQLNEPTNQNSQKSQKKTDKKIIKLWGLV